MLQDGLRMFQDGFKDHSGDFFALQHERAPDALGWLEDAQGWS